MQRLVDVLAAADRPESVFARIRTPTNQDLLRRLGTGDLAVSHAALDAEPPSNSVEHLRSILEHAAFLEKRDHHLALFERWLETKLDTITDPQVRQPVEQFARWHHLRRIRMESTPGTGSRGRVHAAKQEITEPLKFLTWLHNEHGRYLPDCTQEDVDQYLAEGPTTRHLIRTFFVWHRKTGRKRGITIAHRTPQTVPHLTQDERLDWINELLQGSADTLPYRVAGLLLLLYAQPLVRVADLRLADARLTPEGPAIQFTRHPVPVPAPFAAMLLQHLSTRPNQRGNNADSEWLFPSTRAGRHLHPNTIMDRLRSLGINLRAARTRAIRDLVTQAPAPAVAILLGYSHPVAQQHAAAAAAPMARYVSR